MPGRRRVSSYQREYNRHKTHVQDIHNRARHVTNETVESTRRIKSLVNRSQNAGTEAAERLSAQEEKLSESEAHLDSIHDSLQSSHRNLRNAELGEELEEKPSWCCFICYICCRCYKCRRIDRPGRHHEETTGSSSKAALNPRTKLQQSASALKVVHQKDASKAGPSSGTPEYVKRVKNNAQEDEMDKNLHHATSVIGSLKGIASEVTTSLSKSSKQIDKLQAKAFNEHAHVTMAKDRTVKLIKK